MSGFMLVVLGAWGGLIPFIGPYFGYAFGSHATWYYTANRLWLSILPGAAVVIGGLILMRAGHRASGILGAWLAMAGGAWFAVGPAVSRLWEHGAGPIGGPLFGHIRQTLELVGYFYGLGALIIGLAAFALGRFVTQARARCGAGHGRAGCGRAGCGRAGCRPSRSRSNRPRSNPSRSNRWRASRMRTSPSRRSTGSPAR